MTQTQHADIDAEQKLRDLYDSLAKLEEHVESRDYEQAQAVAEDMETLAEEAGCSLCMQTAMGMLSGVVWVRVLPADDDDRREAFLESIRHFKDERVGAELGR